MRKPKLKVCAEPDCGEAFPAIGERKYCQIHDGLHRSDRSKSNPHIRLQRQRLYSSKRWKICKKIVKDRDGHQCVLCGATELEDTLVVDHIGGIDWSDPTNPDLCRTLCNTCSGREDGKRGWKARGASQ